MSDLFKAMAEVYKAVGYVQKEGKMEFGNTKYTYAGEKDLISALRPAMVANGIIMFPNGSRIIKSETIEAKKEYNGKVTYSYQTHIILEATFCFAHVSGDTITVTAIGEGLDTGDKAAYKAMTGALKYALRQSFVIETGDDPDNAATEKGQPAKSKGDISVENREGAADLWSVEQQEEWYTAAETLFSGEPSVKALFAWEGANGNGKRFKMFHDEARANTLRDNYYAALRIGAITDIEKIDGLNELDAFWNKNNRLLKGRLKDLFVDVEQAKNTRNAKLNLNA